MTSSKEVVLEYVVPTLGAVTAVLMFLASMPAVLRARKSGELGELNLIPYPAIVANCVGWVAYAMVVANGFVLGPNAIGLVLGLLYIFACAGLAPQRTLDAMGAVTVLFTVVLVSAGAVGTFRHLDHAALRLLWGYTSNAILLCYYAAPMSTLYHVLCERRADSLSLPLCAMNALNGALWLAYGLAIHDPFLGVPNGVGMIIALVLLAAILVFWRNRGVATPTPEPDIGLLAKEGSSFAALARSIIGQQLATKAAAVIFQRTLEACQCLDTGFLTPESLTTTDMAALRACGLSQRKAEYLTGLARLFSDGVLTNEGIQGMDDATLTMELTKVRGLGQWSVHMFAMFHLGHPDILPVGDLGVRKGMQWLYGLKDLPAPETMEGVAAAWKPYRSVGSHYMWSAAASAPRSPNKKKAQSPAKRKKAAAAGELDGEKPT